LSIDGLIRIRVSLQACHLRNLTVAFRRWRSG
jgi:hypothetical protein